MTNIQVSEELRVHPEGIYAVGETLPLLLMPLYY